MKTDRYGNAKRTLALTPAQWVSLRMAVEDRCAVARKKAIETRAAHVADEADPVAREEWEASSMLDSRIHRVLSRVREAIDRTQKKA